MTLKLTGKIFGRLVVDSENPIRTLSGIIQWNCTCECGSKTIVTGSNLVRNHTKSCGCLSKDAVISRNTTHGLSDSPEYGIWQAMIKRCTKPNDPAYSDYGGRGITVTDRWLNSFEAFYEDMGPRPSPDHSIDREENDKGYYKENCRWVTRIEQANNTRRNVFYEYKGNKYTIPQLAELPEVKDSKIGINTLRSRIRKSKYTVEQSISFPIKPMSVQTHTYNEITKTISEWAKEYRLEYGKLYARLVLYKWDFEKAISTP
jgi:hypothetical protein